MRVTVVPTGTANLASVEAALRRCGAEPARSIEPRSLESDVPAVVPGVGTLRAAMERVRERRLDRPLRDRIERGRPTLLVCLGMQMLASESEESPGTRGLGVLPSTVRRFPDRVRVPQLGWNRVEPDVAAATWMSPGYAYFANSFCLTDPPEGWSVAWATHGIPFVAALRRGAVLACQFHPELSDRWGHDLLQSWLEEGRS